jgi:hypothetical protein
MVTGKQLKAAILARGRGLGSTPLPTSSAHETG